MTKGGGQGGGSTSQGVLKLNQGRTRHLGPCGGDATPIDLDFDSDSAAGSHRFRDFSALGRNLKVKPIGWETTRDKLSPAKRISNLEFVRRNEGCLKLGVSLQSESGSMT